mmetsp:Transcript_27/g.59  ORF Transcript_27/g.59 Transcript_27/m.59 type:complete len:217 (-) Transcript_27:177-827(-)
MPYLMSTLSTKNPQLRRQQHKYYYSLPVKHCYVALPVDYSSVALSWSLPWSMSWLWSWSAGGSAGMFSTMRLWLVYTHMSPAISMERRTTSSAVSEGSASRARAAACANMPPEPTPITPWNGSKTSPFPVSSKVFFASATSSVASSLRRYLSVRHALASSTHARISWSGCLVSLSSSLSKSVNASAVDPANPTTMLSPSRRTFCTLGLITTEPAVT